jgi:hypothetical protein
VQQYSNGCGCYVAISAFESSPVLQCKRHREAILQIAIQVAGNDCRKKFKRHRAMRSAAMDATVSMLWSPLPRIVI